MSTIPSTKSVSLDRINLDETRPSALPSEDNLASQFMRELSQTISRAISKRGADKSIGTTDSSIAGDLRSSNQRDRSTNTPYTHTTFTSITGTTSHVHTIDSSTISSPNHILPAAMSSNIQNPKSISSFRQNKSLKVHRRKSERDGTKDSAVWNDGNILSREIQGINNPNSSISRSESHHKHHHHSRTKGNSSYKHHRHRHHRHHSHTSSNSESSLPSEIPK